MKIIGKIIAAPAILAVTTVKWIAVFCSSMTGWLFHILAIITFLTAIVTYLMQISTGGEMLRMLVAAFILFVLPHVLGVCITGLGRCQEALARAMRS